GSSRLEQSRGRASVARNALRGGRGTYGGVYHRWAARTKVCCQTRTSPSSKGDWRTHGSFPYCACERMGSQNVGCHDDPETFYGCAGASSESDVCGGERDRRRYEARARKPASRAGSDTRIRGSQRRPRWIGGISLVRLHRTP